jgi:curli biogenesis system outer membrane secretion channel CsgG
VEGFIMKKAALFSVLACALVLAGGLPAQAQGKIKIAIWEFENHAENHWAFWNDLGPAARNQIDTEFSENPKLSEKFSVVERDKLNLVMKEQGLAASGALDPQTAAKVGRILGVKYIVTGGIDKFNINNTKAGIGALGFGGNLLQANATINMRMIDTTTAERLLSVSADGEVKKGGARVAGTGVSRDSEWGIASETIQKTAKSLVAKFVAGGYLEKLDAAAPGLALVEGRIIKIEGNKAWINLGASSGIKAGDAFTIFNVGEALIDPDTGAKLGADEKQTGAGSVTEVQDKYAIVTFTGVAKAKDTVRKK